VPKKEKTGRGEKKGPVKWAERYLDKDKDARTLNDLINKYHKHNNIPNKFDGNFWINNISGNEQLINYCEEMMNEPKSASAYEILSRELQILKGLIKNRDLFEKLCKEFNKMLLDNKVYILRYEDIFCIKEDRLADRATDDLLWIRDALGREIIIIPSEDFEIVYAAMRLRADIFVTDEDAILEHSPSFGLNLPLSAASFCRGNRKKANTDNDDKSKEKEKNRYMTYDEKVKEWRLINANNCN